MNNGNNDILDHSLQTLLLTPESRREFVNSLWKCDLPLENFRIPGYEAFFRYYQDQCTTLLCENHCQTKSHRELIRRALEISDQALSQSQLDEWLSSSEANEENRAWTLLTARVLSMVDIGGLRNGVRLGQVSRPWTSGRLGDFLEATFPGTNEEPGDVRLEKLFTARNLERVAGIQVIWTSNLADHLLLEDDDNSVRIFAHISFLELHRNW